MLTLSQKMFWLLLYDHTQIIKLHINTYLPTALKCRVCRDTMLWSQLINPYFYFTSSLPPRDVELGVEWEVEEFVGVGEDVEEGVRKISRRKIETERRKWIISPSQMEGSTHGLLSYESKVLCDEAESCCLSDWQPPHQEPGWDCTAPDYTNKYIKVHFGGISKLYLYLKQTMS